MYNVDVGLYSYGGCFDQSFNLGGKVTIGRYCSFAANIRYFGANHPMNYVSMSPYFYNKKFSPNVKDIERKHLIIGNDCWIGYGVIITNKCTKIGNGAVIAAGSIVTKDVPPYAVVAGNPARIIKYRFDEEIINEIENSKWWEHTPDECLRYYNLIDKPLEFCRGIKNEN
ncbi:MAG: CatB-related O-acetyltransferase [Clostridia bacterium]|nr:CatB-related O-acetyltransferase [Clostridia bacterium]